MVKNLYIELVLHNLTLLKYIRIKAIVTVNGLVFSLFVPYFFLFFFLLPEIHALLNHPLGLKPRGSDLIKACSVVDLRL